MKCEACSADAVVSATQTDTAGGQVNRHLCLDCAQRTGLPVRGAGVDTASRLRGLTRFIRANNRTPSPGEMLQLGGAGVMPATPPGTPEFEEQLRSLEAVADFMERYGRPPTDEELPDPFYRRV